MPVSPPPITTTCLPAALIASPTAGSGAGLPCDAGDPAVALVEVVHREVDAVELAAGGLEVALDPRADRDHDRVVWPRRARSASTSTPTSTPYSNFDPLGLEQLDPAVDHPLLELRVGDAEAHQPAGRLVALVDGDRVADLVELGRGREPGGPGADAPRRAARCRCSGGSGDDPALLEAAVDDRVLDLLDHHRVVVDREHAGRLARRRADQAGELGEVVGRVQLVDRLAPVAAADEVVPVRDQVAERAGGVAERHAAVHAARALLAQLLVRAGRRRSRRSR